MQAKGLIRFLLIAVALASAVQLFYYFPTNRVEKDADSYAEQQASLVPEGSKEVEYKIARNKYLDSLSSENITTIPGLGSFTYNELKGKQLALGLDLKGGMSSVLQVDLKEMLVSLAGRKSNDPDFVSALEQASKAQETSSDNFVTLFADAFNKVAPGKQLSAIFAGSGSLGEVTINTSNDEIIRKLEVSADEIVKLTYQTLKERIDKLGVVQPNVSLDEARQLILVEMPGIDNPKRAREFLQNSAQLDFWHTYRINESLANSLALADQKLAKELGQEAKKETKWEYKYDNDGNVVDSTSVEVDVVTAGPLFSKLDMAYAGYGLFGAADKNKREAVLELLERESVRNLFPRNSKFMWSYKPMDDSNKYGLYLIKTQSGTNKAPLEGEVITDASQGLNMDSNQPVVNIAMNSEGAQKWARMTDEAYRTKGQIAIALDNQIVSAPTVTSGAITGGRTEITGDFTVQEAIDFAKILEVGKLPAKTKIIQESTVGPSLGAANIKASTVSLIIGFGLVLLFMLAYYGGAGLVSIIALFTNLFFIFGALSQLGTVLTLPGIAGIVLTIGMAVDANVIIFERIKEELRDGKALKTAIADGFKFSYSAIIDANVTTFLVALVLAYFGLGPIKGFAIVLMVGVISSLVTAVLFGRLLIEGYTEKGKNMSFWTGLSSNVRTLTIDWMKKGNLAAIISGTLLLISIGSIVTKGFDYGIDFSGGHSYNVQFSEGVNKEELNNKLDDLFGSSTLIKQVDTDNTFNITTQYLIKDKSEEADTKVAAKLLEGVNAVTGQTVALDDFLNADGNSVVKVTSANKVGPTIADDIKASSWKAGLAALALIFLYILIRFNRWQFSLGAIAALVHDSVIVLGLFSLLSGFLTFTLEVDQAFIAAILTIIGYSINDTVVVFDRIREYFGIYQDKESDEIFNLAINSTVSRTIITSLTTLLVVLILLLFGGASIKGFALALVVGILVGTYSSIFVATPIVRKFAGDLKEAFKEKEIEVEPEFGEFEGGDVEPTVEG